MRIPFFDPGNRRCNAGDNPAARWTTGWFVEWQASSELNDLFHRSLGNAVLRSDTKTRQRGIMDILVVDDSRTMRMILQRAIRQAGYRGLNVVRRRMEIRLWRSFVAKIQS